jgi:hypothetical protein
MMAEGPTHEKANAGSSCEYPYERNKQSSAFVPDDIGKFVYKGKNKWSNGKNQRFSVTTGWYLQDSFWGGKSQHVMAAMVEIAADITKDRNSGLPAAAIDREKYWNHYVHGARFPTDIYTLEDAIGSHVCSLEANMLVTNDIPLGCSFLLPVGTVNSVTTLKVQALP